MGNNNLPTFVDESFENTNEILKSFNDDFETDFGFKHEKAFITFMGINIILKNPKTGKKFTITISDDVMSGDKFQYRYQSGIKNKGCLFCIDKDIKYKKLDNLSSELRNKHTSKRNVKWNSKFKK
jgi:hypothetical protein